MEATETSAAEQVPLQALNAPQAEAVAHVDGPLIVFAGAGSGKTRVITYRIANLVARCDVPPYRVLAVTFTNKAAGEMRERLRTILGPEITRALWIGTFHAVCVRLIRRYHESIGIGPNFTIYDDSDQKALMTRILKDLGIDDRRHPPQQILSRIQREKQEARGPDQFERRDYRDDVTIKAYVEYQRRLREANACDFSDLLLYVLELAERQNDPDAEHLRARFDHVLVDEFQDVNHVQYRLVKALGQSRNICVVGDDDQSIYRWRGADVRNIRGFTSDFADTKLVKLEQNYRSSQHIVAAALGIIRHASQRQAKELWTANDAGEPVRIVSCANERDEANYVVRGVQRFLAAQVPANEMAVFYRVHAQSRVLEEAMRAANIPYQIIGGMKFFDRAEVKDVLSYLRVVANPKSDVDLLRIINRPARKIGKKTIDALIAVSREEGCCLYDAIIPVCGSDRIGKAAKKALKAFDDLLQPFFAAAESGSPRDLAHDIVEESGYLRWLKQQDSAEADARIDNIQELLGAIAEYEEEMAYAEEDARLADYLTRISLVAAADTLEDIPRVPMMTIHAAKGLEFDVVYLTGMEEKLFPLGAREERDAAGQLEEERRLAYVAVTRARERLYCTHTQTRMIYGQTRYNSPSRFLAEIPLEHQELEATSEMERLGRSFTHGSAPSWRDIVRAGSPRPAPATARMPMPPQRARGERYIEADDVAMDRMEAFDGVDDDFEVRIGTRVRHPRFGSGPIVRIGVGPNPSVSVDFDGWGVKSIKLSYLAPA